MMIKSPVCIDCMIMMPQKIIRITVCVCVRLYVCVVCVCALPIYNVVTGQDYFTHSFNTSEV